MRLPNRQKLLELKNYEFDLNGSPFYNKNTILLCSGCAEKDSRGLSRVPVQKKRNINNFFKCSKKYDRFCSANFEITEIKVTYRLTDRQTD
jgi:hypothetical protein